MAADRVPQGWRTGRRARSCHVGACLCTGLCQYRAEQSCSAGSRSSPSRLGKTWDRPPPSRPRSARHAPRRTRSRPGAGSASVPRRRAARAEHAKRPRQHSLGHAHGRARPPNRQDHADAPARDARSNKAPTKTSGPQIRQRRSCTRSPIAAKRSADREAQGVARQETGGNAGLIASTTGVDAPPTIFRG